jgi:hypothetical protein
MSDYLQPQLQDKTLPLALLWSTLFDLLLPIWPSRTTLPSHPTYALGDAWPCPSLVKHLKSRTEGDDLVPFHKLTQWLCYSLVEGIEAEAGWKVDRVRGQTGLPEVSSCSEGLAYDQYRNGGLLMDLGLITIRPESLPEGSYKEGKATLDPSHPAVVEWRAITVITL